jgi:hypothetical protein
MADDGDDKCMRLQKAAASVCGGELTDEEVRESLEKYSTNITRTEDAVGARFTHRVAVPARSRNIPRTQNIPSNLSKMGTLVQGTIRPPFVHVRALRDATGGDNKERFKNKLKRIGITEDVDGVEILPTLTQPRENEIRPHIAVRREAGWPVYISILEAVHDGYKDLFEG